VREALIWLGEEDPVLGVDYGNDGTSEIAVAFQAMHALARAKLVGNPPMFKASDLAIWCSGNYMLRDALDQAGCQDTNSAAKVGMWLRTLKNRIAGGLRLVPKVVDGGRQPNKWVLQSTEERDDQ
jgi:hypothetical protein